MMERAYEIPASEVNGNLLRRLIVAMPKKKGIVSRLEI